MLTASVALHALIIYLLATGSPGSYRLDASVIEAEVIPVDRHILKPPLFPSVMLQESRRIEVPPLQIAIDVPAEQGQATQAIDVRDVDASASAGGLPVASSPPPEIDPGSVVLPRPISGPRGVDRYPTASLKEKESGTVVMNICISSAGRVDSVELARSSGFPRLDQVALGIASEYQFQPATRHGRPIAACVPYSIVFKVT